MVHILVEHLLEYILVHILEVHILGPTCIYRYMERTMVYLYRKKKRKREKGKQIIQQHMHVTHLTHAQYLSKLRHETIQFRCVVPGGRALGYVLWPHQVHD